MRNPVFTIDEPLTRFYSADAFDIDLCTDDLYQCIIADPPYGIGVDYGECKDRWKTFGEYMAWLRRRIVRLLSHMADTGSMWLIVPPRVAAHIWAYVEDMRHSMICDQIVWHYRFGQHTDRKYIPSHVTVLWIRRKGFANFYPDEVLVESDRASKYSDKRINDSSRGGKRVPLDVWTEFPRVTGNSKERRSEHPNQLPERLIERIIRCCTKPGDKVLDPFVGSGTTTCVAKALGRESDGLDVSKRYLVSAYERTIEGPVNVELLEECAA